jgi:hypothetical protein
VGAKRVLRGSFGAAIAFFIFLKQSKNGLVFNLNDFRVLFLDKYFCFKVYIGRKGLSLHKGQKNEELKVSIRKRRNTKAFGGLVSVRISFFDILSKQKSKKYEKKSAK